MQAPSDRVDHDRLFNFRLWKLAALAGAPVIRLCEGRYGINRREWLLLAVLARDGELSPSGLAEHASLDRARSSKAFGNLLAKQLVVRTALPGDRRQALVKLSTSGWELVHDLYPQIAEINARVFSVLDAATRDVFDNALRTLTEHAAQVNQDLARDVQADRHRGGARKPWS